MKFQHQLIRWSRYLILVVLLISLIVLAGWSFNINILEHPFKGHTTMNPTTALGLLLSSISFLLLIAPTYSKNKTITGNILAIFVVLAGITRLTDSLFSGSIHIDTVLFARKVLDGTSGGVLNRMTPTAAFGLVLSGTCLLLLNTRIHSKRWFATGGALLLSLLALLSIIGYLYKVTAFYGIFTYVPMAFQTAISFLLIGMAVLMARPSEGIMKEMTSNYAGGFTSRVVIPLVILIPIGLGLLRLQAHWRGIFSVEFGVAILVISIIIVFLAITWYNAVLLNRRDALRKISEDTLRENEQKYRLLVNNVKDYAIFMIDATGHILSWNEGAEKIKGYSASEITGASIAVFYTQEDQEKNEPARSLAMAKEKGRYESEGWRVKKDGSTFWANVVITALYDNEYRLQGFTKITRDITEKKKADEKFRNLLEAAPDAMVIANEQGKIVLVNKQTETLFGYTRDELIDQPVEMLVPANIRSKHVGHRDGYITNPKVRSMGMGFELFAVRKDGTQFPVEISLAPLVTEEGTLISASVRDISERKKAEEKISHLARLMEDTSDAIFSTDSSYIIKSWNKGAELQFGYTPAEAIGKTARELLRAQVNEESRAVLRNKVIEQGYWRGEITYLKKDGTPITVLISVSVTHNVKGEIDGFVNIAQDISERKKLEIQLKEFNIELEKQVQSKTAELTGIFERITDAFIALDKDFRYIYVNKKAGELIHHDPQALIGKCVWDVFPDAVGSSTHKAFTKAMNEQTYIIDEDYYPPLSLWQENHIYPSPEGLSIFIRDITERKKSEAALRYSEETRRLIMNSALDAIVGIDSTGNIIAWNPQAEKIFGWAYEEVMGKSLANTIIPLQYRDRHKQGMAHYAKTGHGPVLNKVIEITALDRHGNEFPIELAIVPIHQDGEEIFCAFIRDITERKKNEEVVKASEKKYKLLFESNPMPMWMLSLPDLNFIDVNESAVVHYGYSREEFLSMNATQLRPAEDIERFLQQSRSKGEGTRFAGIWRHKRKDGSIIYVDAIAHDVIYEGKAVRLILSNDVTEKLKAEQDLKRSFEDIRQLASRLQEIREEERAAMAREVHDELGQQITGLKMDVSWVSKRIETENEPVKKKVKGILELLDTTVKTVRKIATELRPSILDDLGLAEAMQWQSIEFEKRSGISVEFVSSLEHVTVPGDVAIGLFRIYQESLTNVARHANATKVKSSFGQRNGELILEISDNGKGFDMLKSGQKKTLGLLGMKERTQMMGGKYEINSQPGTGTTVLVSIPYNEKPHSEQ